MQIINRNNYEEYFLLYADNELDAALKNEVENFVQQNTDLAVELQMLMQTKSLPGQITFNDKEMLLRTEGNSINENNYEEYFLLYIDDELSTAKREEVEMYVLQHPKFQNEFTNLKRAVLKKEDISYGDKKDLYRTEKRRAVYMQPWRFLAAAAFIGACAFGWWLWQKPATVISTADNYLKQNQIKQNTSIAKSTDSIQQSAKLQQQTVAQQSPVIENEKVKVIASPSKKIEIEKKKETDIAEAQQTTQPTELRKEIHPNNVIKQHEQPVISNDNDVAVTKTSSNQKEKTVTALPQDKDNIENNNNGYRIYNIAYKEINTSDDDNSLHVGVLDLNKDKVKGLLKKASRFFTKKQDNLANEDGKLQIANFEIQTNKQ